MLDRSAVGVDAEQMTLAPVDPAAGARDPQQRALVGARHDAHADDGLSVPGKVLDLEAPVGKCFPEARHELALALRARRRAGQSVVVHVLGSDELVDSGQIPSIERVFPKEPDAADKVVVHFLS